MVMATIKHYFYIHGLLGNTAIFGGSDSFASMAWKYDQQDEWMGSCKTGLAQSPIVLRDSDSVKTKAMRLVPKWQSQSIPVAKFNGHEVVVLGDFGQTIFQIGGRAKIYNSYEIRFKFPSEHMQGDSPMDGEMQIFHRSNTGGEAIASIFLKKGSDGASDHNLFIENLEVESWKFNPGKAARLDSRPDLSQIVKGGVTAYYQKTFYYYRGSKSTPPCEEGIDRFIFKEAIVLPGTQFDNLKRKTYDAEDEPSGNARKPVNNKEGVYLYLHIDESVNCKLASDKILAAAEEQIAKIESEKTTKAVQGKFIKARTYLNTYGAMFGDGIPPFQKKDINGGTDDSDVIIDSVQEGDVPAEVRTKLGAEEYNRVMKYSKEVLTQKGLDINRVHVKTALDEQYS